LPGKKEERRKYEGYTFKPILVHSVVDPVTPPGKKEEGRSV
jgi:hypothetical protein